MVMSINSKMTALANEIRTLSGTSGKLGIDAMTSVLKEVNANANISSTPKHIKFYDYDGTLLHSYSLKEAQKLNELPALPQHDGLVCQGWNCDLDTLKTYKNDLNIGAMYTTSDGTTRIYIHLDEGRTSPMLGIGVEGSVTVDWGDGSTPDTLSGTKVSTVTWTPTHNYDAPGDYVITLAVDGSIGFLGYNAANNYSYILRHSSSSDRRNVTYCNSVRKIEIGDNVTHIGSNAFRACYSLTSITVPANIPSIGNSGVFQNCYSLTSFTIPNNVTSIGISMFDGCQSLTSVSIPVCVTTIGNSAFYTCRSLTSITVPDYVTSFGTNTFYGCSSLTSINIPDGITTINGGLFNLCYALSSIKIPDGVTIINANAFHSCRALDSINIPDSVTNIGVSAFDDCGSLASIKIPDGITAINNSTFYGCYSLGSMNIPDSVTSIGSNAFNGCSSLQSVNIPEGVTSINTNTFYNCASLDSVVLPDGLISIGSGAFRGCTSLSSVVIPATVTSIGGNAFTGCHSLSSITIPDGLTLIDASLLDTCYSITSLKIPSGVTSIGNNAFYNCYAMRYYDFSECTAVPSLSNTNGFYSIAADCEILVPASLYDEWIVATNWTAHKSYIKAV